MLDSFKLTFDAAIVNNKRIERLADDGVWCACPARGARTDGVRAHYEFALQLEAMRPVVLRFS